LFYLDNQKKKLKGRIDMSAEKRIREKGVPGKGLRE